MEREERQRLKGAVDEVAALHKRAVALVRDRQRVQAEADAAAELLFDRSAPVVLDQHALWHALQLTPADASAVTVMARATALPTVPSSIQQGIDQLTTNAEQALHDVKPMFGTRRMFSGKDRKDAAEQAAAYLSKLRDWLTSIEMSNGLQSIAAGGKASVANLGVSSILGSSVGFTERAMDGVELLVRHELDPAVEAVAAIDRAIHRESEFRTAVTTAGNAVRQAEARTLVSEMGVERLKDATNGQVRISALTSAGIRTVQQVLDQGGRIVTLPGVGETTGNRMIGAARTIWQTTFDEMPVRIDIRNRSTTATALLKALQAWDSARAIKSGSRILAIAETLRPLLAVLNRTTTHVVVAPDMGTVGDLRLAIADVTTQASALTTGKGGPAKADPWDDFLARPADYFAMLSELGFLTEDDETSQGDLPDEILEAIRDCTLDTTHLTASLRGYQSFGARFAVVQSKVIIGDEMGLGKTVESLAVLTHLRAKGSHHFLVVCPAAVVTNWVREVSAKSDLRVHRLHGPGRDGALTAWVRNGGVAVTTYDSLAWLDGQIPERAKPACLVFDEAHYIKNPEALRTRRSRALIQDCERTILLTGTPLENRIEEFRNLVGYLRPDLTVDATEFAPRQFRKQVAPAYLRRNQEDVLTELPELVEVDEWLPMSADDELAYRDAVYAGNFMAMRQAAMLDDASEKMERLAEIVEEAEENGRRVIVFSYFRNVLDRVAYTLPGQVFGPLTGSVPAVARQTMIDEFSAAKHGAVLVSQIVAGGVGLNIQAASVVIICEPQLKPTTEWQAIARAHRMGQLETVQVHRLLSEDGVDQRITDILARKKALFDEFARVSETAESAPEAFDISEAELAREVVAAERERLFGQSAPAPDEAVI